MIFTKRDIVILAGGLILFFVAMISADASAAEYTVGVIMTGDIPYYQELHQAFMARIVKEGISSKTAVVLQKPYPDSISLKNAARKLIATGVDVIVAYGAPAAAAVIQENTDIPLVFAATYAPFMSQLRIKNGTGINVKLSISSLLRYLRGLKQISALAVIYSSNEEDSVSQFSEITKLAAQYGIKIDGINIRRYQEAASKLAGIKVDAIMMTGSSVAHMAMPAIAEIAKERKLPIASFMLCRNARSVVSLAASPIENGEKAAEKVIKILDGTSPEKIKVDTAHVVELTFNFREATAMGWKLPMDLVTEATKLIK